MLKFMPRASVDNAVEPNRWWSDDDFVVVFYFINNKSIQGP